MRLLPRVFIRIVLFLFLSLSIFHFALAQINQTFEAENATLKGTAVIVSCNSASGGKMVKGLENGSFNSITFQKVDIPETGEYFVSISYYAISEKNLTFQVNDEEEVSKKVNSTGVWCYQGGQPGEFILKVNLAKGENNLLFYNAPIIDKIEILTDTIARKASAFYVSSSTGNNSSNGLTPETAFQTISKINSFELLPGDSLLFKSGDTLKGNFIILNEGGTKDLPIVISNYGEGKLPVLDGDGYLSAIHIVNSGSLHFSNIEIINNGGQSKPGEPENLRYGVYIQNTYTDGTYFENYRFKNLSINNIYPTIEVTEDDNTGVNAHAIITSGSWGDSIHPTRFDDMVIENCFFTRTARHATVLKAVNNLVIRNNLFEHVGGAGMVIAAGCTNILVEKNVTNYTGSSIDSRMAGRGSGIWCYRSKNLTVQYNKFLHAKGIHDSYGMHIDIGNRNVVYQYNYSEDNEGGFAEILGENSNVGYRFNVSVGDGWRKRGNRHGQVFWLAGWSGDPQNPIGSDSIFLYNNSIYVRDSIAPGIWIENVSKKARIYNNIINVSNEFGPVVIKNSSDLNDFDYNIWYGNIPLTDEDGQLYRGQNALVANPLFKDEVVADSSGFVLKYGSPAIASGKLIYNAEIDRAFDCFDNNGRLDFFGNEVADSTPLNIGADNGKPFEIVAIEGFELKQSIRIFPNPVRSAQQLNIEIPLNENVQKVRIQFVDVDGRIRLEKIFQQQHNVVINTKDLKRGIYFLKVEVDELAEVKMIQVL